MSDRLPSTAYPAGPDPLAALLLDQAGRWRQGDPVPVEEYRRRHPGLADDALLDLIWQEVVLRQERGESPGLGEYLERFPSLAEPLRVQFQLESLLCTTGRFPSSLRVTPAGPVPELTPRSFGDFTLLGLLGRGGMGVVYRARQLSLNRVVALKLIHAGAAGPEGRARFRTEAEAVARLQHPNVVQIFEVGEHDGVPYLCLEFAAGGSLDRLLAGTPQPPRDAAALVETLARAVQHAHDRGIVHRDLKPANVLLQEDLTPSRKGAKEESKEEPKSSLLFPGGLAALRETPFTPKVADFGLAKLLQEDEGQTRSGAVLGTPSYAAPEQAGGGPVTPAVDVYALGAILYECLTGRPPFRGATAVETLQQVLYGDPVPVRTLQPAAPADLETVCLKCLHKDPAGRYASAGELADELRRFLNHEPIRARPPGALGRAARWCRRHPGLAGVAATAAVALTVVTAVSVAFALYALAAAADLRREQGLTSAALRDVVATNHLASRRLTENELDRALQQGDGEHDPAACLLWLARALGDVPDGEPDLEWAVRANLAAWATEARPLGSLLPVSGGGPSTAISPDGKRLAVGDIDGKVRRWDVDSGEPVGQPLPLHQDLVVSVAFRPDGRLAASGGSDRVVRFWDPATGEPVGDPLPCPDRSVRVEFSPDGKSLLSWGETEVRVREAPSGRPVGEPLQVPGVAVARFGPAGDTVFVVSGEGKFLAWEPTSGKPPRPWVALRSDRPLLVAALSPDGKTALANALREDSRLFDTSTGEPFGPSLTGHTTPPSPVAFAPDGATFLTGSPDGAVRRWNAATGLPVGDPVRQGSFVMGVGFGPGDTWLTADEFGTVRLWDPAPGKAVGSPLPAAAGPADVAFGAGGRALAAVVAGDEVVTWDLAAGRPVGAPLRTGKVAGVTLAPGGARAVTRDADGTAQMWDTVTGQPLPEFRPTRGSRPQAAFSPDGARLVTCDVEHPARLWDAVTGRQLGDPLSHPAQDPAIRFRPDGKAVLLVGPELEIRVDPDGGRGERPRGPAIARLWDADTGWPLGPPVEVGAWAYATVFDPDGNTLLVPAVGDDPAGRWDLLTGQALEPGPYQALPRAARLEQTDDFLVTWSQSRWVGTLGLWDARTGKPVGRPLRHPAAVRCFAFSPDRRTVATGDAGGAVRLWAAGTGKPVGPPLRHGHGLAIVAVGPDGATLATRAEQEGPRLWRLPSPVQGTPGRVRLWVEVLTGMELDDQGEVRVLGAGEWRERKRRVAEAGGPP
jgi:WD40 repeat protein